GEGRRSRRVAFDGSPRLAHHVPEVMDEQHPGLHLVRILHAVDGDGDFCHAISSPGEQDVFPGANLGLPGPEAPVPSRVRISDTRNKGLLNAFRPENTPPIWHWLSQAIV